jgi:integrase
MPINIRSSLKPFQRKDRGKWYPRGTFPIVLQDGKIERKRDFLGPGRDTKAMCQQDCDRLNAELEAAAGAGPKEQTFEESVLTYLQAGGDRRFLGEEEGKPPNRLLQFLGHYRVNEIDDVVMTQAWRELYPNAASITVNRQLYTPVIAVLRMAAKGKPWKPALTRPKGYSKLKPAKAPPDSWYNRLKREAPPRLWALVLFITLHGRRPSDGFRRVPADYDPVEQTIEIDKDKNGDPILVGLCEPVVEALQAFNWQEGPGLFGTLTWKSRRNAYRMLKAACKRAQAPYFTFHKAGRHAFAKRLLKQGYSLAHVKSGGRWKSGRVVAELYGHLEHSEVDEITRRAGEAWAKGLGQTKDNVTEFPKPGDKPVTKRPRQNPQTVKAAANNG